MLKNKYRVRLKNGRIVGPFTPEQISELYAKGHMDGTEQAQVFPGGNWEKADGQAELLECFVAAISKTPATSIHEPSISFPTRNTKDKLALPKASVIEKELEKEQAPVKETNPKSASQGEFKEFKFSTSENPVEIKVDYEQLEKQYQEDAKKAEAEEKEEFERTRIKKLDTNVDLDKTVVRPDAVPYTDFFKVKEEPKKEEAPTPPPVPVEDQGPSSSDKTLMITLNEALPELKVAVEKAEEELQELILEKEQEEQQKLEALNPELAKETKKEDPKNILKKKGMKPIVFIAFLAIFVVLLFPENEKTLGDIKPEYSVISFPIADSIEDSNKAASELKEGIKIYNKGTYLDKLRAAEHFKKSLEAKISDNPQALGWIVLTYAELFPNAESRDNSTKNLYRLIQLARGRIITDINVAIGSAIFYGEIKKLSTATTVIENFLRVKKQPSSKLFAVYLDLLIKSGRWIDAGKVYLQLKEVKSLPVDAYLPMVHFLNFDGHQDEAKKLLEDALKRFPSSVPLFLEYCSVLLNDGNFVAFDKALENLKKTSAENSPIQVSKYLEFLGMQGIIKKNTEVATNYFNKALKIHESDELRSKLSALEIGGSQKVESLIRESKILNLINKSRTAESERRWEDAFAAAIEAADLSNDYIPAQLWLASIQIKRGYFNGAITTLEKIQKDNQQNSQVNFALIRAYIEAKKLDLAQRLLAQFNNSKLGRTAEFAFNMGLYYKNTSANLAVKWFSTTIDINPVYDQAYYELAQLYFDARKYDKSKSYISKALDLDPENSIYHGLNARIIYETENADTAIGYLRDVLETKVDDPYLIGEIAIHYQRSGKQKEFELYQKKFESLVKPTTNFYDHMMYVSRLNDNFDNIISYGNEYLKINPGAMEVRLTLGEAYMKKQMWKNALEMFVSVRDRLPSYPKVNYWIAKASLSLNDYKNAYKFAKDEIAFNPSNEHGYFILGETYKMEQKWAEALNSLEKALSLNGNSIETLYSLAWIKHRQNYPNIARDFYTKILKLDPSNVETNKQLGLVYKDLGQGTLAIEYLKTYLDLNPGAEDRIQIEAQIRQLQ